MPDLLHALPANDLAFLRIVAELWGLELTAAEPAEAVSELADLLADADLIDETLAALPADARAALEALAAEAGRMTWVSFSRRFGAIREMGPGRRDRDRPHLHPTSPAETLYYRGLLARAFFETPTGPQEFAYVPDDFLLFLEPELPDQELDGAKGSQKADGIDPQDSLRTPSPKGSTAKSMVLGRPASPGERALAIPASDRILDDATTLLAAVRMGLEPPIMPISARVLREFLAAAGILTEPLSATPPPESRGGGRDAGPLNPECVRSFLEASRPEALSVLAQAWRTGENFNELRQLPGLAFEGEWSNQPLVTREFLLNLLEALPGGQWWSLPAFLRDMKARYPDFQRPAGDYDSWFIRRESDGAYLRGFANWDAVDGALVRYLIEGPLFWLGRVELAASGEEMPVTAFRLLDGLAQEEEKGKLAMTSAGQISVERLIPRAARYQIARFCEWEGERGDVYRYRVTARSLKSASEQGLKAGQLLSLLARYAGGQVPPALVKALKRWEARGTEARLEQVTILRVSKPEVLAELKKSPAARFLGETLGPTAVVVQAGAAPKVLAALAELGLLAETSLDDH
jgi:hypothetical protein